MFTTDRLILRESRATDVANFQRIWNDKRCQRSMSLQYLVPVDEEKAKVFMKQISEDPERLLALAITLKPLADETEGAFVGRITLRSTSAKNREGIVGLAILPDYWNKGYGTEALRFLVDYAFRDMNLHRMSLEVLEGNDGAKKVYDKVGFKVEGVRKRANWLEGRWRDITMMAIIEDEYWADHPLKEE